MASTILLCHLHLSLYYYLMATGFYFQTALHALWSQCNKDICYYLTISIPVTKHFLNKDNMPRRDKIQLGRITIEQPTLVRFWSTLSLIGGGSDVFASQTKLGLSAVFATNELAI